MDKIRAIAERVARSNGLEVVDLEFRGSGKARVLRIYIDKPAGVTHGDCEAVSREVGTILDVEDAVPGGQYILEVSSPGLDRKLRKLADYERFTGSVIRVETREPVAGTRHFRGRLQGVRDGRIALELQAGTLKRGAQGATAKGSGTSAGHLEIDLANVEKANLVPEF